MAKNQFASVEFSEGYKDSSQNLKPNQIGVPSQNVRITTDFRVESRKGYIPTNWDLDESGSSAQSLYVQRYNVTFFSLNGKVKYIEHDRNNAVVDTGLSLTATETTRFAEYAGDIFCINPTDGLYQIHVFRLNDSAPDSGDAAVTVDQDGIARLLAFSDTSGNLRIRGTNEAYAITASVGVTNAADNGSGLIRITTASAHNYSTGMQATITGVAGTTEANGTWTVTRVDATKIDLQGSTFANTYSSGGTVVIYPDGQMRITSNLSANYADNDIAIVVTNKSSGRPKGSKIVFWKNRMIIIGVRSDVNTDNATQIAYMSQFVSARDLQKLIVFGNSGGASEEWIGTSGSLKNAVSTRDYLYFFKEDETYFSPVGTVDQSTGATFPQLLSSNYGCVNENCAVDMGSGVIAFLTNNKRIIAIQIDSSSGSAVVFPDETFDQSIRNTLRLLDEDQSESLMYYHKASRLLFIQVSVDSQILTLIYDNNIGKWLPPDTNKAFSSYFEKEGILYATQSGDDTIFEMDTGEEDDGNAFESVVGLPRLEFEDGRITMELKELHLSGCISEAGEIQVQQVVSDGTPQVKTITTDGLSFGSFLSLGTVTLGTVALSSGSVVDMAQWDKRYGIYPRFGRSFQAILSGTKPFSVSSYKLLTEALPRPLLTLK